MKKLAFGLVLLLAPSYAFAEIESDFFNATSSVATSTFAGSVAVNGLLELSGASGISHLVDYLSRGFLNITGKGVEESGDTASPALFKLYSAANEVEGEHHQLIAGGVELTGGSVSVNSITDYDELGGGGLWLSGGGVNGNDNGAYPAEITIGGGHTVSDGNVTMGGELTLVAGGGGDTGDITNGAFNLRQKDGKFTFYKLNTIPAVLDFSNITAPREYIVPDISGAFGLITASQTWSGDNVFTGVNVFTKGASATTTVTFGSLSSATSKACFNTKNTAGSNISFYFVGTSMVVEANTCK